VNDYNVIIRPLVTEQGIHFANVKNAYSFQVNKKANKVQIRHAVEHLYNVKVTDVRTAHVKGKPRRRGRSFGRTPDWKKAVVVLHPDYRIDLF
jgi:large subunit ribosomal protein L23